MNIKYDYRTKNEVVDKCFLNGIEFLRVTLPGGLRIEVDKDVNGEPMIELIQDCMIDELTLFTYPCDIGNVLLEDKLNAAYAKLDHVAKFARVILDHGSEVTEAGLRGIISFCEKKALGA